MSTPPTMPPRFFRYRPPSRVRVTLHVVGHLWAIAALLSVPMLIVSLSTANIQLLAGTVFGILACISFSCLCLGTCHICEMLEDYPKPPVDDRIYRKPNMPDLR